MNSEGEKILIPGTGSAQIDFIRFCKKQGFEVYCCSNKDDGRWRQVADEFVLMDINDRQSILDYVKENDIKYIYTVGSDLTLHTTSEVSEKLNLPAFVDSQTVLNCTDKSRLRKILKSYPEYSVLFRKVNSISELKSWNFSLQLLNLMTARDKEGSRKFLLQLI